MSNIQLVVHHDDLGASHGANLAFVELADLGVVTCGSVMVPCPWFPEMAAICRDRPDLDVGVHLTLNAEFAGFRWRPLTGVAANGLTDTDGFMWRRVQDARHADVAAVEAELRRQVETALAAGIDVTHLDSHMGTVTMPEYVEIYLRLGEEFRLPVVFARDVGDSAASGPAYDAIVERLVARGNPDFQRFIMSPFGNLAPDATTYAGIFRRAVPGLNWGAFHFAQPGDIEMYSDDAPMRVAEYELFRSGRAQELLDAAGVEIIGMRGFRDAMRA